MASHHRLARLLEMITLVRRNSRLKAKDLAEHFGISRKRVFDDIEDLNMAGVPMVYDAEQEGYRILPGFFLPPTNLSIDEALTLVLSLHQMEQQGTLPANLSASLLAGKAIEWLKQDDQRIVMELCSQLLQPQKKKTTTSRVLFSLALASAEGRRVSVRQSGTGPDSSAECLLEPFSLAFRGNAWYLIALSHASHELQTLKVDAIESARILDQKFVRPPGFSLEDFFSRTWNSASTKVFEIRVRFFTHPAPLIQEVPFQEVELTPHDEGGTLFTARTEDLEGAMEWVMKQGVRAVVLAPSELRDRVAREVEAMHRLYPSPV